MRNWLLDRMRRRKSKTPNESESFGKVGQELPSRSAGQLAPLQPNYDLESPQAANASAKSPGLPAPAVSTAPAPSSAQPPATEGQPEKRARRSRRGGKRRSGKKPPAPAPAPSAHKVEAEADFAQDDADDDTDDFGNEFAEANGKMETETQPELTSTKKSPAGTTVLG